MGESLKPVRVIDRHGPLLPLSLCLSLGVGPSHAVSEPYYGGDCKCTELTIEDYNTGKLLGYCLEPDNTGSTYCYVPATSGCYDKTSSARTRGLFFSYEACNEYYNGGSVPAAFPAADSIGK